MPGTARIYHLYHQLIIPLFLAFRYSFTSWDGMSAEKIFVGFQNYIDLFKDADFRSAWWFTIKFTIGNTIIQNVAALLFAVALDSGIKAQKVYRTAFFCTVSDQCGNCGFCVAENVLKCIAGD